MKVTSSFKRLYLDIETSPNIGMFWESGYKKNISYDNIIKERAIICICYKWKSHIQKREKCPINDSRPYNIKISFNWRNYL